jgi:hypothetical protein
MKRRHSAIRYITAENCALILLPENYNSAVNKGKNMSIRELIIKEMDNVPEEQLQEVLDFIRSLEKVKAVTKKLGTAIVSENVLKKDWMRPEEEKAWKNL